MIERHPILTAGNSVGDLLMLVFTSGLSASALRPLVMHDDAEREFECIAGARSRWANLFAGLFVAVIVLLKQSIPKQAPSNQLTPLHIYDSLFFVAAKSVEDMLPDVDHARRAFADPERT